MEPHREKKKTPEMRTVTSIQLPLDMMSAGRAEAASAEQTAYRFWVTLTLRCQRLQIFVGANIRPPRHI